MEPDISNWRGGMLGGGQSTAKPGLVDVAECHILRRELGQYLSVVPGSVPHLNYQRIVSKFLDQVFEIASIFIGVLERNRELNEQGPQAVLCRDGIKPFFGVPFILFERIERCRRCRLQYGS